MYKDFNIRKDLIKLSEEAEIELKDIFFNSDEFTSHFIFWNPSKNLNFAYKIHEKYEGFSKPVIIFKNYCDEKTYISFTIEKLTKKELELKLIKEYSSKNIKINTEIIKLNRTAGPPENMD